MGINLKNKNDDSVWELSHVDYHLKRIGRVQPESLEDVITLKPIQTKVTKSEARMTRKQFDRGVAFGFWITLTA